MSYKMIKKHTFYKNLEFNKYNILNIKIQNLSNSNESMNQITGAKFKQETQRTNFVLKKKEHKN